MSLRNQMKKYCSRHSVSRNETLDPNFSFYSELNVVGNMGNPSKRMILILVGKGCSWARQGGPCTMCNYWIIRNEKVNHENLVNQLLSELEKYDFEKDAIDEITLVVSGSFLNEEEVPFETQKELLKILSRLPINKIMVEGRADYIKRDKIVELKKQIPHLILEIGIGLESSNDFIRNVVINKGLAKEAFEKAVKEVSGNDDITMITSVLIKPPFLTEGEAVADAIESANYIFDVCEKHNVNVKVDFEPVHVKPYTLVNDLYERKQYTSPWLWSIIEVIKAVKDKKFTQVLLSTENYEWFQKPRNCEKCSETIRDEIDAFNVNNDYGKLLQFDCDCKKDWELEYNKESSLSLEDRIRLFFDMEAKEGIRFN